MREVCHVCGKPLDEIYAVTCVVCGREIHFQSADPPGDNCGRILTQLDVCGLAFVCNVCSEQLSPVDKETRSSSPS